MGREADKGGRMTSKEIELMILARLKDEDIIEASTGRMRDRVISVANRLLILRPTFDVASMTGNWDGEFISLYLGKGEKTLVVSVGAGRRPEFYGEKTQVTDFSEEFDSAKEAMEWLLKEEE
jgi:hypothetical protein